MSASEHGRHAGLIVASFPLLLGACASLIGLESAEVDETASASASASASDAGSSTSSGGEGTGGEAPTSSSAGTGGGGVGGGAGLTEVSVLDAGFRGTRLAAGNASLEEVLILGTISDYTASCYGSATDESQALVLRQVPSAAEPCAPVVASVTSRNIQARSLNVGAGGRIAIGGVFHENTLLAGDMALAVEARGAFAVLFHEGAYVTHAAAETNDDADGRPAPLDGFAFPKLDADGVAFVASFEGAERAMPDCYVNAGEDVVAFRGEGDYPACIMQPYLANVGVLDAVGGANVGLALLENAAGEVDATLLAGIAPDTVRLGTREASSGTEAFRAAFVPIFDEPEVLSRESYFIVSADLVDGGCGGDEVHGPATLRLGLTGELLDRLECRSYWERAGATRLLAGSGINAEAVVGVRTREGEAPKWTLANLVPGPARQESATREVDICTACEVDDIAISGGRIWILARAENEPPIVGGVPQQNAVKRSFLVSAAHEELFGE